MRQAGAAGRCSSSRHRGRQCRPRSGHFGASTGATITKAATEAKLNVIRDAAGPRFADLILKAPLQRVIFSSRRQDAAAEVGEALDLDAADVLNSPHALIGTAEIAEDLLERRERFGITSFAVSSEVIDDFTPVIAKLAGR